MNPSVHAYQMQASPVMNWSLANAIRLCWVVQVQKSSVTVHSPVSVKVSVNSLPCDRPFIWPHLI